MAKKNGVRLHSRILVVLGVFTRLFYCLGSTIYERQYDISEMNLAAGYSGGGGHLGYIHYIYTYGHIPREGLTEVYQFSHPPLHYLVSAAWMKLCSLFIRDPEKLSESIQAVPFVCSVAALWALFRILEEISDLRNPGPEGTLTAAVPAGSGTKFSGEGGTRTKTQTGLVLAEAVFAFHPALILLSGSVNNDGGSFLAAVLCILWTIRWLKDPSYGMIARLALALGLGMMVKQSVAEMAFPIAAVFLMALCRSIRAGRRKTAGFEGNGVYPAAEAESGRGAEILPLSSLIGQYALFLVISVPLGMWFYLRGLIGYGMPLVFVHTLPEDSWQYIGGVPVINRYLWPVIPEFLDNLRHFRIGCGYNVWLQIMRTSVLGEWDMAEVSRGVKVLAMLLMFAGAALALAVFPVFVRMLIPGGARTAGTGASLSGTPEGSGAEAGAAGRPAKGADSFPLNAVRVFFLVGYAVHMLLYFRFSYAYPQQCSMNYRYITVTLVFTAAALAAEGEPEARAAAPGKRPVRPGAEKAGESGSVRSPFLIGLTVVFCVLSLMMTAYWSIA